MTLNIGHIPYINCAPFFHYLPQTGFNRRIVPGVPSRLNRLLAAGEIDLSPSSSFEYARNWRDYLLLPGHSISACGPVQSVLLFSSRPPEALEGEEIALTGESATSVNLLLVLLREFYGHREVLCRVPEEPVEETIATGRPALLIGDRALKASRSQAPTGRIYDLSELWLQHTGLPFVFALWILRRQAAEEKGEEVRAFLSSLSEARNSAFASLPRLAEDTPERSWMGEEGLIDYWEAMSYDLGPTHLEGLKFFFYLCRRHGLLKEEPEIRFFE